VQSRDLCAPAWYTEDPSIRICNEARVCQGCQMVIFPTKNPNLVKFWMAFKCWCRLCPFGIYYGHLVYVMAIWYSLWTFGKFYGHLVYFMDIW
jgi:hypothetical protein